MVLLTQKRAKTILRQNGFSVRRADEIVADLKKIADGMRQKVRGADIQRVISEFNQPTVIIGGTRISRPLSEKMKARIRAANGVNL